MVREIEFRMERTGLIQEGDEVTLEEYQHGTLAGIMYYYIISPAVAMSNNIAERLCNLTGTVKQIKEKNGVYTVIVVVQEGN